MLRFFAFRSPDAKDMRRSVTTRTRDTSMLLTTPRAAARPLIQVHHTSGCSASVVQISVWVVLHVPRSHTILWIRIRVDLGSFIRIPDRERGPGSRSKEIDQIYQQSYRTNLFPAFQ
jgi:hypothetical protein